MNRGKFRHRIFCDEPMTTQDANGEEVVSFPAYLSFRVWSQIEPLTGRELLTGRQTLAEGTTRIRIFWSTRAERINAKWRLRHGNTVYNIAGPPMHIEMARRVIEIMATSGVNAG